MTGAQYQRAIDRLGLSQVAAAKFLKVDDTTSRNWVSERRRIPHAVELLLKLMLQTKTMPADLDGGR